MDNKEVFAFDWDSEIADDGKSGKLVILPEGDYVFTVEKFTRGSYAGSAKLPSCPMASLDLVVEYDGGKAHAFEDIKLCSTMEWLISAFMRSIGQKKHGERIRPNWSNVQGARGKAHFKPEDYTTKSGEHKQKNTVDHFLDWDENVAQQKEPEVLTDDDTDLPFSI